MTRIRRTLAAAASLTLVGLAGCSSGPSADPEPSEKPGGALAKLDPCKIMTPQQLQAGGFTVGGPVKQFDFEPGCDYGSESVELRIYKNQQQTVESYKENGNWSEYAFIQVNDRQGARSRVAGDTEDSCSTMISAGGGVVYVAVNSDDPRKPIDGCAESLKIAKQIEPNLPE